MQFDNSNMRGATFQNLTADEGVSAQGGIRTQLHFQGETIITQRTQDMEPVLAYVQGRREQLEGKGWGEGKEVGHIPELFYAPIRAEKDITKRKQMVRQFFRDHPAFCFYPAYLKEHPKAAAPVREVPKLSDAVLLDWAPREA